MGIRKKALGWIFVNNKTNLFVCVFAALLISLQCNISVYAADESDSITATDTATTDIAPEETITNEGAANTGITDGQDLTEDAFALEDKGIQ